MKKLFFLTALSFFALLSFGQKVDLDKFNFTFDYRGLPAAPQKPEYKTFSVNVTTTATVRGNYGDTGIEDAINMQGWKKVTGTKGHLIVSVSLEDLMINSSAVTERVDVQKDKDGKETGRKYYYKTDVTYSWAGSAAAADYQGNSLGRTSVGNSSGTWSSSEYGTRKEAVDYYNNNKYSIRDNLLRKEVGEALTSVNGWLDDNYGYPVRKEYEILWVLDSKKHPEYQAQHDAWETFKAAVATVTADNLSAETKEKFEKVIKYFDEVPAKFATDDKGDKKMRYAAFYNKAKIYLYLDNPAAAMKEADALIANGYDDGDGKRLKKDAEALAASLQKNNTTTRHFSIDLSTAAPPAAN